MTANPFLQIKKALLMSPPTGICFRDGRCQGNIELLTAQPERIPMELAYMAGIIQSKGVETRLRDFPIEGATWEDVNFELKSFEPELVVLNVVSPTFDYDLSVCAKAKELNPNIITLAKGAHFDVNDVESLENYPDLDLVVRHENEIVMMNLMEKLTLEEIPGITFRNSSGEIIKNPNQHFYRDMDSLPFPARNLLRNELYTRPDTGEALTTIMTARGCPYKCTFCLAGVLSDYNVTMRNYKLVVDEIQECVEKYNITNFFFYADTFTMSRTWVLNYCNEIVSRGLGNKIKWGANSRVDTLDEEKIVAMKSAGCEVIGFGVESGTQETLDKTKKGITLEQSQVAIALCKKYRIKAYTLFVLGFPWETKDHLQKTVDFAVKLDGDFADFTVAYPYPGTEMYDQAKELNLFDEADLSGHDISRSMQATQYLSTEELTKFRKYAIRRFYGRPSFIFKKLLEIRTFNQFKGYASTGWHILTDIILRNPELDGENYSDTGKDIEKFLVKESLPPDQSKKLNEVKETVSL